MAGISNRCTGSRTDPRPELVQKLTRVGPQRLVLLVAPPGYGKSTLLAQWAEQDPREFAWLSPSDQSADLTRAVRVARACAHSFVVVLDDAQRIDPTRLRAMVDASLKLLPDGSSIALASRFEPPLALSRLRAHRALAEIGIDELSMSTAEAKLVLAQEGLKLPRAELERLVRCADGWPAVLYLATLALREQPAAPVPAYGRHHLISAYLRDEVLQPLGEELRTFAIRTSVLEELSGTGCDLLLGRQDSTPLLDELARNCPLLVPVDSVHERYRWHALMRDKLQAELKRTGPKLETRLHLRASGWFATRGDAPLAIEHAVAAGAAEPTADLLWRNAIAFIGHGRRDRVRLWLSALGDDRVSGNERLSLIAALCAVTAGNLDEAQRWLTSSAAAGELARAHHRQSLHRTMITGADAITARNCIGAMDQLAASLLRSEPKDSQWRPLCLLLRAVARHLRGDRAAALTTLEKAIVLSGDTSPALTAMCLGQLGMIAIERKDWELASDSTERAIALLKRWRLQDDPLAALPFAAAAVTRVQQGRVDEAKQALRAGVDRLAVLGEFVPWYGAEVRVLLARASLLLTDVAATRALLAEASRLARRTPEATIFDSWFDEAWGYLDGLAETSLSGPASLTIAELRILRFLPSHRSFREIAGQLGVSANTVKTQAHAVYRKLGAASRSEAVERALDAGLLGR